MNKFSQIPINLIKGNKKPEIINSLSSVILYINKDNLFSNFFEKKNEEEEPSINYELILKKILLPFFKMKSRVLKRDSYFKIGEIEFKVAGISPGIKGKVNNNTYIKCSNYYSSENIVKRALLISNEKYENFNENDFLGELFNDNNNKRNLVINKNHVLRLRNNKSFFIRNCEPETGRLDSTSQITIENKEVYDLEKIEIAVIKVK